MTIRELAREAFGKAFRGTTPANTGEQLDAAIVAVLQHVKASVHADINATTTFLEHEGQLRILHRLDALLSSLAVTETK